MDGYREPATQGAPDVRQSAPPTVPITTLYPQGNYPIGKEEPYTVSEWMVTIWHQGRVDHHSQGKLFKRIDRLYRAWMGFNLFVS